MTHPTPISHPQCQPEDPTATPQTSRGASIARTVAGGFPSAVEVRLILQHLGISAKRPLTRQEINHARRGKQSGIQRKTTPETCDCGRQATHRFNGPECDECRRMRLEAEHNIRNAGV